jgi:MFS transporter, DHA2 family, multidrug resistance protein
MSDVAGQGPGAVDPFNRLLVVFFLMIPTIMTVLDSTIANVALPYMMGSLSTTQDQINWVLTSYMIATAIMTPPSGWLAARFGRKRLLLICVVGFTVSSILCGLAQSLDQIVAARVLQGLFGAAFVPISQAEMLDLFPQQQQGSAMAIWGMGIMIGPVVGPTLGGYLTEYYEWRWVFLINIPFGILAFVGILAVMRERLQPLRAGFDWIGFLLLGVSLAALQAMLDRGHQLDWFESPEIIAEATIAATCMVLFLVQILTAKHPFVEPGLFRDRNLSAGLLIQFCVGFVLIATTALLTPYLQLLMGYPVMDAGIVLAPRGLGTGLAMLIVSRLIVRFDPRLIVVFGMSLAGVMLYEMSHWTPDVSQGEIIWVGFVQGFGLGFVFVPLSTMAFATLAPHYRGEGAAFISLVRNVGSSIGISICMFLLVQNTVINAADISAHVSPFNPNLWAAPSAWDTNTVGGMGALAGEAVRQGQIIAYADDFRLMFYICFLILPMLALMTRPPRLGPPKPEELAAEA